MIDDQLSPEEQEIVRQIQATSKPKLDAPVRDEIRQRMVAEFRAITPSGSSHTQPVRPRFTIRWTVALVAAMIVAVIGLAIIQSGNQKAAEIDTISTITLSPDSQIAIVPSAAPTMLVTPVPSLTTEPGSGLPTTQFATPSATPQMVVNIEGPVTSIVNNVVTIYGFNIEVEPQHPILQVIDVGDVIRVTGVLNKDNVVSATVISNLPDSTPVNGSAPTVGLDGPVEAINDNTIIVNSIPVQLAPNDPLLQTIQVGNFVSVQGDFQTTGTAIVLAVVNIAIVNNTVIQSDCWYHVDAMGMGHWHCDGMGMGMGMGEPDGMGMGDDDGMGMGG